MKKYLIALLLALNIGAAYSQEPLKLQFLCEVKVKLNQPLVVGETPHGLRRIITFGGGTVTGPALKGTIFPSGADWQIVRKDGVAEVEAHLQFKTDDGTIIYLVTTGLRVASPEIAAKLAKGEPVPASAYYFRAVPKFEAPYGKYGWLNNYIFVCTGEKLPNSVVLKVWKVL